MRRIRVLHVVKTSDGAPWAAWLARELSALGIDLHVALPSRQGTKLHEWIEAGATIHEAQLDFPLRAPWHIPEVYARARRLVDFVKPDVIHSHFVGTTLTLRHALGKTHPIPRVFQIPGPLHLEHQLYRRLEIGSAKPSDYWIASSRCIERLLRTGGVSADRIFLSYYGSPIEKHARERTHALRNRLGIPPTQLMVGNISWIYRPKLMVGQRVGLKCHEDMIQALAIVTRKRGDVTGVLAGSGFRPGDQAYAQKLRNLAEKEGCGRILMPGALEHQVVRQAWPDFDCAIHVPLSENTGGVTEPMFAGVPTIASKVGGLPEVVMDGITGKLVEPRNPPQLAEAILEVLDDLPRYRAMADLGSRMSTEMYDVTRTAREVFDTYRFLLEPRVARPSEFDSRIKVEQLRNEAGRSAQVAVTHE